MGTFDTASALTDPAGVARVKFTTTMHPGDNFRIAVSADSNYLNGLVVSGIKIAEPGGLLLPTKGAKAGGMLTVWRMVHVELDSMGLVGSNRANGTITSVVVPSDCPKGSGNVGCYDYSKRVVWVDQQLESGRFENGRLVVNGVSYVVAYNSTDSLTVLTPNEAPPESAQFTVFDDDDYDGSNISWTQLNGDEGADVNQLSDTLALMRSSTLCDPDPAKACDNVFAHAYIQPSYNWAANAGYNQNDAPFKLNVDVSTESLWNQVTNFIGSAGSERDDFWVVYIQLGYQRSVTDDNDPNLEFEWLGSTVSDSRTEGDIRDVLGASVPKGLRASMVFLEVVRDASLEVGAYLRAKTTPHEVGHQFGLKGDVDGYGLMSLPGPSRLVPSHINILRSRVKSPGQN